MGYLLTGLKALFRQNFSDCFQIPLSERMSRQVGRINMTEQFENSVI